MVCFLWPFSWCLEQELLRRPSCLFLTKHPRLTKQQFIILFKVCISILYNIKYKLYRYMYPWNFNRKVSLYYHEQSRKCCPQTWCPNVNTKITMTWIFQMNESTKHYQKSENKTYNSREKELLFGLGFRYLVLGFGCSVGVSYFSSVLALLLRFNTTVRIFHSGQVLGLVILLYGLIPG